MLFFMECYGEFKSHWTLGFYQEIYHDFINHKLIYEDNLLEKKTQILR